MIFNGWARKVAMCCSIAECGLFRPVGITANTLQGVTLSLEEVESIRLKDLEGLEQEECAQQMRRNIDDQRFVLLRQSDGGLKK